MSALHPDYGGRTGSGPSPSIWSNFDGLDPSLYYKFWDDFVGFRLTEAVASNVGTYVSEGGGYYSYEDTGDSIINLETEVGGIIRIATDATDNDEVWMMPGSTKSVFGKIADTNGAMLAFECRVRPQEIVTRNFFVGMSEEGLAAADTISDAGAFADKDFIGFRSLEGDANAIDTAYNVAAGGGILTVQDDVKTLVANTWYKFGFLFNPISGNKDKMVRFFVDGVEQGSYITQANLEAATFPDGEEMHFLIGIKNGAGALNRLDLDWVKIAQMR